MRSRIVMWHGGMSPVARCRLHILSTVGSTPYTVQYSVLGVQYLLVLEYLIRLYD